MSRKLKTYSDLMRFDSYDARLKYLKLNNVVGDATFGGLRHLNQTFYKSRNWKRIRNQVIQRDLACDLGVPGFDIYGSIYIHHMNPITPKILTDSPALALDLEYLITTSFDTHQMIHFGIERKDEWVERTPGDTKLW